MINGEPHRPYSRTLINKAVLQGLLIPEQSALPAMGPLDVGLLQARVTGADAHRSIVVLDDGHPLPYVALIDATGSTPRPDDRVTQGVGCST